MRYREIYELENFWNRVLLLLCCLKQITFFGSFDELTYYYSNVKAHAIKTLLGAWKIAPTFAT